MSKVTLKGIGPAERQIANLLISDITAGDRNNAMMARTVRHQLKLRELRQLMEQLTHEAQDAMISDLGDEPDQQIVTAIKQQIVGVGWHVLIDEGYGDGDVYGQDYGVDKTTLEWLNNLRKGRTMWIWRIGENGERTARELQPDMLEAIANFDEAVDEALKPQSGGNGVKPVVDS